MAKKEFINDVQVHTGNDRLVLKIAFYFDRKDKSCDSVVLDATFDASFANESPWRYQKFIPILEVMRNDGIIDHAINEIKDQINDDVFRALKRP